MRESPQRKPVEKGKDPFRRTRHLSSSSPGEKFVGGFFGALWGLVIGNFLITVAPFAWLGVSYYATSLILWLEGLGFTLPVVSYNFLSFGQATCLEVVVHGDAITAAIFGGGMPAVPALSAVERAKEIHGFVGPVTQDKTTIAVVETNQGVRVIASSEQTLRHVQAGSLQMGEIAASGRGHAEVTAIRGAIEMGLTPTGCAASREICSSCLQVMHDNGVTALSPVK